MTTLLNNSITSVLFFIAALVFMYLFVSLVSYGVLVKAGDKGFKGFIPIYRSYLIFKYSTGNMYSFFLYIALAVVGVLFPGLMFVANFYLLFVNYKKIRAYGHGFGLMLLYWICPPLVSLLLAFDGKAYIPDPKDSRRKIGVGAAIGSIVLGSILATIIISILVMVPIYLLFVKYIFLYIGIR